jgi:hypothetical protein
MRDLGRKPMATKKMREIRVRWTPGLHQDLSEERELTIGGTWFPDNERNRDDLTVIVESGNEVAGEGSHWLEERDA